jgi:hypothetical protein
MSVIGKVVNWFSNGGILKLAQKDIDSEGNKLNQISNNEKRRNFTTGTSFSNFVDSVDIKSSKTPENKK